MFLLALENSDLYIYVLVDCERTLGRERGKGEEGLLGEGEEKGVIAL